MTCSSGVSDVGVDAKQCLQPLRQTSDPRPTNASYEQREWVIPESVESVINWEKRRFMAFAFLNILVNMSHPISLSINILVLLSVPKQDIPNSIFSPTSSLSKEELTQECLHLCHPKRVLGWLNRKLTTNQRSKELKLGKLGCSWYLMDAPWSYLSEKAEPPILPPA